MKIPDKIPNNAMDWRDDEDFMEYARAYWPTDVETIETKISETCSYRLRMRYRGWIGALAHHAAGKEPENVGRSLLDWRDDADFMEYARTYFVDDVETIETQVSDAAVYRLRIRYRGWRGAIDYYRGDPIFS